MQGYLSRSGSEFIVFQEPLFHMQLCNAQSCRAEFGCTDGGLYYSLPVKLITNSIDF